MLPMAMSMDNVITMVMSDMTPIALISLNAVMVHPRGYTVDIVMASGKMSYCLSPKLEPLLGVIVVVMFDANNEIRVSVYATDLLKRDAV